MRDPELRDASITVTSVDVSPDLRNATAFVMPLGGKDSARLLAALRRAAPWFRARVSEKAGLRDPVTVHNFYVPAGGDEPDPAVNVKFAHKLAFLDELHAMAGWLGLDVVATTDRGELAPELARAGVATLAGDAA